MAHAIVSMVGMAMTAAYVVALWARESLRLPTQQMPHTQKQLARAAVCVTLRQEIVHVISVIREIIAERPFASILAPGMVNVSA